MINKSLYDNTLKSFETIYCGLEWIRSGVVEWCGLGTPSLQIKNSDKIKLFQQLK